jgi:hypothetical protein
MSNPDRRKLFKLVGAGALASQVSWATEPELRRPRMPRMLVNAFALSLKKSPGGTTVFVADFGGTLGADGHLHSIGGQLVFNNFPTEAALAVAVKKAMIQKSAAEYAVNIRAKDIAVIAPTFH